MGPLSKPVLVFNLTTNYVTIYQMYRHLAKNVWISGRVHREGTLWAKNRLPPETAAGRIYDQPRVQAGTYGSAEGPPRVVENKNLLSHPDDLRMEAYVIRMT